MMMKTLRKTALLGGLAACVLTIAAGVGLKPAEVGDKAPDFTLKDTTGKEYTLTQFNKEGKIVVLEWFNPDCPVSAGFHAKSGEQVMAKTAEAFKDKGVVWLAINSGATGMQGSGLERNQRAVEDFEIKYPVLLDEPGEVGRAYGAKTTPHMYVIDAQGVLRYAGAIDNQKKGEDRINYVENAVKALLAGETVNPDETRAYGCGVKYARGGGRGR